MNAAFAAGIMVSPQPDSEGNIVFADVEPAGSRWLPWPGRMSRWWYEVHSNGQRGPTTFAYQEGGSGGGFTLRSCTRKAMRAVSEIVDTQA